MSKEKRPILLRAFVILLLSFMTACDTADPPQPQWPEITSENKPWTRWWWQGSAVDRENLTRELEQFKEANIGGVEITSIYGVAGYANPHPAGSRQPGYGDRHGRAF